MRNIIKKAVSKVLYDFGDKDTEEKVRYRFSRKYRERLDSRLQAFDMNLKLIESKPKQEPIVIVFVYTFCMSWLGYKLIDSLIPMRVSPYSEKGALEYRRKYL